MISQDRMEKALRYLAETDESVSEAEGELLRAEYLSKLVEDRLFLSSVGTVAERQAKAGSSHELAEARESYVQALVTLKKLKAKRVTEEQIIQVWRSQEASSRNQRV